MMRILVLLANVFLVTAGPFVAGPECGVSVGDAITSLVEGSTHLYHSIKDCKVAAGPAASPKAHKKASFLCTADIFDLVSSVAETSKYSVNVFGSCFDKHVSKPRCVVASLSLAQSVADIVASLAEFENACYDHIARAPGARKLHGVTCAVDVKKAMEFSLDTLGAATTIKKRCDYSAAECTAGIFDGIGSLAGVAEYVLAAFGDCGSKAPINTRCGQDIAKLIKALAGVATHSISVKAACTNYTSLHEGETPTSSAIEGFQSGISESFDKDKLKTNWECCSALRQRD
jgi:hypothetical protein